MSTLSSYPKISALQNSTLVNGQLQNASRFSPGESSTTQISSNTASVDLSDILERLRIAEETITELTERLDAATIDANCENGTVTVALNL